MRTREEYIPPEEVVQCLREWEKIQPPEPMSSSRDLPRCFIEGRSGKTSVLQVQVQHHAQVERNLIHSATGNLLMSAASPAGQPINELIIHPQAASAPPSAREAIDYVSLFLWAARISVLPHGATIVFPSGETAHGYFSDGPIRVASLSADVHTVLEVARAGKEPIARADQVNAIGWKTAKYSSRHRGVAKYRTSHTHLTIGQPRNGEEWEVITLCDMVVPIAQDDGLEPLPEEGLLHHAGLLCTACLAALPAPLGDEVIRNHGLQHLLPRDMKG